MSLRLLVSHSLLLFEHNNFLRPRYFLKGIIHPGVLNGGSSDGAVLQSPHHENINEYVLLFNFQKVA